MFILTSTGLSNPLIFEKVKNFSQNPATKKVAIVTTAAKGKEQNKYSILAKKQLEEIGFNQINFVDLETDGAQAIPDYDVLYVCGGNTFYLLKHAGQTNFKKSLIRFIEKGGLYIGVSAGSVIVGPSIAIAGEVDPDPNNVGLTDLTGLNLIKLTIHPHYNQEHEAAVIAFEQKHGVTVTRLANNQAIVIQNKQIEILE